MGIRGSTLGGEVQMVAAVRPDAADGGVGSSATRWYVLLMMVLVYTLSIADRYVISTVLEPIRLELQLTDSGIAFLTGVALALFYVVLGFPISYLIDRGNRRNIIAICLILWSAMTAFTGLSKNYIQLLISRIGVGVGEAGGTPGANSIISDYFPAAKRPMALTIFSLGAPIGAWIGADIAGIINDAFNWRTVFLVLGIPGIVVGLVILATIKEPRRGQLDHKGGDSKGASFGESMRFLWTQKSAVHVMVASALTALWGWGLMWWTPTFLIRNYGLTPGSAGAILGPIHLIGGGLVTLLTGWWMSKPSMRDPRRIVRLMGWGVLVATIVSFFIYWTRDLQLATILFWIFIPSIYFYIGPSFGGAETLITHPATVTYYDYTREKRYELGITDTLFRLAVGLEDVKDIIGDLERAFAKAKIK